MFLWGEVGLSLFLKNAESIRKKRENKKTFPVLLQIFLFVCLCQ